MPTWVRAKQSSGNRNPPSIKVEIFNDTGSTAMTLSPQDAAKLGIDKPDYIGYLREGPLKFANDEIVTVKQAYVEICLTYPWSPDSIWITERAMIFQPGRKKFSGSHMRDVFYFATSPSKSKLCIAQDKKTLFQLLP